MRRIKSRCLLAVCVIAGFILQGSTATEVKTIKRIHDPVVMDCKQFKPLFGSPINRLALMVLKGDKWAPIPFQIDQKKPDGTYAYASGPGASPDPDPNVDANDELVFMVKDAGDHAGGAWPNGATFGMEIEITDPKNGQKGWFYLIKFPGKAPRSKADYIRVEVDAAKKYRKVITYEYTMGGSTDRMYPDFMAATKPGGGTALDVLDRLKIRGKIVILGGIKIPYKMDSMTKSKDIGYIDGPVRVLHFAQGYLEFIKPFKLKGKGQSVISYYVNHMMWPLIIDVPFNSISIIKRVDTTGYMDFCPTVYGSYPFSAANPYNRNVVFDGKMSDAEKNLDRKTPIAWIAGFGPQGALINRLIIQPKGATVLLPYFLDDETIKDSPEDCKGTSAVGYKIIGTKKQVRGTVTLQYYYFLSKLKPAEVHKILDILDHPVKVKVKTIGSLN